MKAAIYTRYGEPEVLQLKEVGKPVPGEKEVVIKICAASVNYGDMLARKFRYITRKEFNMPGLFRLMARLAFGWKKPKIPILGSEFSGIIESTGSQVTRFRPGDTVFGFSGQKMGAYAEYLLLPENGVIDFKPNNMSFEEAAVVPYGSIMAVYLLRKAGLIAGQKVLVAGASGGIGSAAVQIAAASGAEVTGVCSTQQFDFVKSLGARYVIDYAQTDFTTNGKQYDLIVDVLGKYCYTSVKNALTSNGHILYVSFKLKKLLQSIWQRKMICGLAPGRVSELQEVKILIESGKFQAGIDKIFPLDQIAQAHRYAEERKARGKIAISLQ